MSNKKDLDFEKLSSFKPKKANIKSDTEQAVKAIHGKCDEKEKIKRVTIDLPFSLYVLLRKRTIEDEITMKDYFVEILKNELKHRQ